MRPLLTELARANLIAEHRPGRYTFHDLLRAYAADLTHAYDTGDERRDTVARLLDHYVDTADAAARLLYPEKLRLPPTRTGSTPTAGTAAEALVWLDAELSNMVAAAVHAAGSGPRRAAWLLADTLHGYLRARGAFSEWRTLAGAGLTAAEAEADLDAQAAIHLALSWLEWRGHGDPKRAVWHCAPGRGPHRAERVAGRAGRCDGQPRHHALERRAADRSRRQVPPGPRPPAAHRATRRCRHRQANLGGVYADLGDLTRSAGFTEQALELYRRVGARRGEAMCLADLAVTDHARGHLDKALDHANQALALHRLIGDRVAETETLRVVSEIHRDLGHDAEAITALATAVHQLEDLPDHIYQAELLNSLAAARHTLGDHPATVDYYAAGGTPGAQGQRPEVMDHRAHRPGQRGPAAGQSRPGLRTSAARARRGPRLRLPDPRGHRPDRPGQVRPAPGVHGSGHRAGPAGPCRSPRHRPRTRAGRRAAHPGRCGQSALSGRVKVSAVATDRYALLLRGINLGRTRRVPMADLRALLTAEGYRDVATLLQSGNAVFEADVAAPAALAEAVEVAIAARFGFPVDVVLRTRAEVAAVVERNPFADVADNGSRYFVSFLGAPLSAAERTDLTARLDAVEAGGDLFAVDPAEVYVWCPKGLMESPVMTALGKLKGGPVATVRNWNTVEKLAKLLG